MLSGPRTDKQQWRRKTQNSMSKPRLRRLGKIGWWGVSPQLSEAKVRRCVLPSRSIIPGDSTNKNMHYENTGQRKVMKYLRESCYHCIECSVTNSLAALMRKWYLNSNFQFYNYSQILQESVDVIRINISNLIYMWMVEMREGR